MAPGTETHCDDAGMLQLRRAVVPRGLIVRTLNRWFHHTDHVEVRLDAQGTFFWRQIDGRRSLEDIARDLARCFTLAESESREAVVVFTKMLMIRQLIHLRVALPGERV
jgi:hypothetical protein